MLLSVPTNEQSGTYDRLTLLRRVIAFRRGRSGIIDEPIFAEPAWDILLEIYFAGLSGQASTVASACEAANIPKTTGLRWLTLLQEKGLVLKLPATTEVPVISYGLTPRGEQKMALLADGLTQLFVPGVGEGIKCHGEIGGGL